MNSKKYEYLGLTTILVISILAMSTAVTSADDRHSQKSQCFINAEIAEYAEF